MHNLDDRKIMPYHQHTYEDYVYLLADTAFVLCPAGNNPGDVNPLLPILIYRPISDQSLVIVSHVRLLTV